MVAVILNEKNDSARAGFEQMVVYRLQKIGYHAVASSSEFGPGKLSRLNEEATYLSLCDNGIDAVLTFAEVDRSAKPSIKKGIGKNYAHLFYYERIWNYRKIRDNATSKTVSAPLEWECILFDLVSLQTQAVLRIGETDTSQESGVAYLADKFIQKMISVKALGKMAKTSINPKPF